MTNKRLNKEKYTFPKHFKEIKNINYLVVGPNPLSSRTNINKDL
jgi:hypothetical protein